MIRDKSKKLSVIIPVFNTDKELLIRCFESIEKQTYQYFEVLVIDDGSEKEYSQFLESCCNQYGYQYIWQKNAGVSVARNNGIDRCSGEYISFVDSDDYLEASCFERGIALSETNSSDMVLGGINMIKGEDSISCCVSTESQIIYIDEDIKKLQKYMLAIQVEKGSAELKGLRCSGPWAKMIRKSSMGNLRFDTNLPVYEDLMFNLLLLDKMDKVVVDNYAWYNYVLYETSAMHKYRKNGIEEELLVISKLQSFSNTHGDEFNTPVALKTVECLLRALNGTLFHKESIIKNRWSVLKEVLNDDSINSLLFKIDLGEYDSISLKRRMFIYALKYKRYFELFVYYLIRSVVTVIGL